MAPRRTRTITHAAALLLAVSSTAFLTSCNAPRPTSVMVESGQRAERLGDLNKAEAEYLAAVKKRPGNRPAREALGRLYLNTDRPRDAATQFEILAAQSPANERLIDLLAQALLASDQTDRLAELVTDHAFTKGTPRGWVRAGDWLSQAGDMDGALVAYRTAARIDRGQSASIQRRLAEFHRALGDTDNAIRRYRMAYALDPNDQRTIDGIRALGKVPGPTFALTPEEAQPGTDN